MMKNVNNRTSTIQQVDYDAGVPVAAPKRPAASCLSPYRGTSLTRKRTPPGPHSRPMPRALGES